MFFFIDFVVMFQEFVVEYEFIDFLVVKQIGFDGSLSLIVVSFGAY